MSCGPIQLRMVLSRDQRYPARAERFFLGDLRRCTPGLGRVSLRLNCERCALQITHRHSKRCNARAYVYQRSRKILVQLADEAVVAPDKFSALRFRRSGI